MSNYGMKVSLEGHAISEADRYMILTSKFPFLKAKVQGSASKSITAAGTHTVTINHALGYPPAYIYFGQINVTAPTERYPGSFGAAGAGTIGTASYINSSDLILSWTDTHVSGAVAYPYTVFFYYYLFYDQLS